MADAVPPPPWNTLTDAEIRTWILDTAEAESDFERSDAVGPLTGLYELVALAQQRAWDVAIRPIVADIDPEVATGFALRIHGLNAGVPYRATARAARGAATVTSAAGGRVRTGAVIEADGQQFTIDADARLTAGIDAAVAVTAVTPGAAGNVAAGTPAVWAPGEVEARRVPADATVTLDAQWITIYGYDPDDLTTDVGTEAYRRRVLAGYGVKGAAHIDARYRSVALGVPGVTNVATRRTPRGYDSVDVAVLVDRRAPTGAELALVRAAIGEAGIVGSDILVGAPRVVTVVVTAEITGTATVETVEAAIEAWWRRTISIGDGLLRQDLFREATAGIPGLETVDFLSPAANIAGTAFAWLQPAIAVTPL